MAEITPLNAEALAGLRDGFEASAANRMAMNAVTAQILNGYRQWRCHPSGSFRPLLAVQLPECRTFRGQEESWA